MAGRPIDHRHRTALLDAAVDHAIANGLAGVSLRTMAKALGVSPTTLVHHFGTKEQLLEAILAGLRTRMLTANAAAVGDDPTVASIARAVWARSSSARRDGEFRLFFAAYGHALQDPGSFSGFLEHVVSDWRAALARAAGGGEPTATLVVATLRGLLLDLLATGERRRVDAAAEAFLSSLEKERAAG